MGMLFTGGDCSESFNTQADVFSCVDYQGGPSNEPGTQAWIQVTSCKGEGAKYHDDWVTVGDTFYINDGDQPLVADQRISIYSSADKSEDSLLQVVEFSTACTGNLALKDRFGASQVVEWYNVQQGAVSTMVNVSFNIALDIPPSAGAGLTLESAKVSMTYGGASTDLTIDLGGTFIPAGTVLPVTVPATIDVTEDLSYSFSIEVVGVDANGNNCIGSGSYSFTSGPNQPNTPAPTSNSLPTPTISPGVSSPPVVPEIPTMGTIPPGKFDHAHAIKRITSSGLISTTFVEQQVLQSHQHRWPLHQ